MGFISKLVALDATLRGNYEAKQAQEEAQLHTTSHQSQGLVRRNALRRKRSVLLVRFNDKQDQNHAEASPQRFMELKNQLETLVRSNAIRRRSKSRSMSRSKSHRSKPKSKKSKSKSVHFGGGIGRPFYGPLVQGPTAPRTEPFVVKSILKPTPPPPKQPLVLKSILKNTRPPTVRFQSGLPNSRPVAISFR